MIVLLEKATLTSKGQVTIPKIVREQLCLFTGDNIIFRQGETEDVYIQKENILDICPVCKGSGQLREDVTCPVCAGEKKVVINNPLNSILDIVMYGRQRPHG